MGIVGDLSLCQIEKSLGPWMGIGMLYRSCWWGCGHGSGA